MGGVYVTWWLLGDLTQPGPWNIAVRLISIVVGTLCNAVVLSWFPIPPGSADDLICDGGTWRRE